MRRFDGLAEARKRHERHFHDRHVQNIKKFAGKQEREIVVFFFAGLGTNLEQFGPIWTNWDQLME